MPDNCFNLAYLIFYHLGPTLSGRVSKRLIMLATITLYTKARRSRQTPIRDVVTRKCVIGASSQEQAQNLSSKARLQTSGAVT
jgi:hypothetical protein